MGERRGIVCGVLVPRAGRVRARGDSDHHHAGVRGRYEGDARCEPSLAHLVEEHSRVGEAVSGRDLEEQVEVEQLQQVTLLVPDRAARVDHLDHLARPRRDLRVRRRYELVGAQCQLLVQAGACEGAQDLFGGTGGCGAGGGQGGCHL